MSPLNRLTNGIRDHMRSIYKYMHESGTVNFPACTKLSLEFNDIH